MLKLYLVMIRKDAKREQQRKRKAMTQNQNQNNQGRKTPKEQVHLITMMGRQDYTAQQITDALEKEYQGEARGLRTVQNILKASFQNRIPWDRLRTSSGDLRVILDVLAAVMKVSEGKKREFTQDEADWVAWVGHAAPTLPVYYIWVVACLYMAESRLTKEFAPLDAFLAFKPWESLDGMNSYNDLCDQGWIPDSKVIVEVAADARQAVYPSEDRDHVTSDKANPLSLLAQLGNQGLPIDESHASLGMVYTNPPDNAGEGEVEEEPELLDGAYRVISESTTGQILKPQEAETNEPLSEEEIPERFWPLLEAQGWKPPAKKVDE